MSDAAEVARTLAATRGAARAPAAPFDWAPILYATFSRLPRADPGRAAGTRQVARLLRDRGADASAVTELDRAQGEFVCRVSGPPRADTATLDEMLMITAQQGAARMVERLLDPGASVNGAPAAEEVPIRHAAWRGYPALHASRHCNHPEGGPTMQTVAEIPQAPYAAGVD